MKKAKERIKLEKIIIRAVQHYLCEDDKDNVKLGDGLIDGLGLDSLDVMELSISLEKNFSFTEKDVVWDAFWSNSQATVKDLCDFVEKRIQYGIEEE